MVKEASLGDGKEHLGAWGQGYLNQQGLWRGTEGSPRVWCVPGLLPYGITEDQGAQGWDVAGGCAPPRKERHR